MRVIVCGLGQVGYRVTLLLARLGEEVTVLSLAPREEFVEEVSEAGCKLILGDARNEKHLVQAGIARADSVIVCMDDDLANIEVALDARRLNPSVRLVVRVFDQNVARRLEDSLGVNRTLGMSLVSAPAFAAAAIGESIRGTFSFEGESYAIGRVTRGSLDAVGDDFPHLQLQSETVNGRVEILCEQRNFASLASRGEGLKAPRKRRRRSTWMSAFDPRTLGRTLVAIWKNAPLPLKGVAAAILVLSVLSGFVFHFGMHLSAIDSIYFVITTVTTVGYGDITPKDSALWLKIYGCLLMLLGSASVATLYSIVTDFVVSLKFDEMLGRSRVSAGDHVIVVGLGGVGYRTVNELRKLGVEVVGVDLKPDAEYRAFIDRDVPFVSGDGRDPETLERAGIEHATAVLALTDNDAVNLSIGLVAKQVRPAVRSVLRLFNSQFAEKVRGTMEIDSAMSALKIAAPSFVGAALYDEALFSYLEQDRFVTVLRSLSGTGPKDEHLEWSVRHPTLGDQTLVVASRTLAPQRPGL